MSHRRGSPGSCRRCLGLDHVSVLDIVPSGRGDAGHARQAAKSEVFQGYTIRAVRTGTAAMHPYGACDTYQPGCAGPNDSANRTTTTGIDRTTPDIADPAFTRRSPDLSWLSTRPSPGLRRVWRSGYWQSQQWAAARNPTGHYARLRAMTSR